MTNVYHTVKDTTDLLVGLSYKLTVIIIIIIIITEYPWHD